MAFKTPRLVGIPDSGFGYPPSAFWLLTYPHGSVSAPPRCHRHLSSTASHAPAALPMRPGLIPRSSGFYPPLCYQASQALSHQYPPWICHPLTPPRFGSSLSGRFSTASDSIQRQVSRASLGKTQHLPISRPTSLRFTGYWASLSHACSTSSPLPYSRFAVRYVHGFCLMLPPDGPLLVTALALSALPFRPVTAGSFASSLAAGSAAAASCQAHVKCSPRTRG